MWHLSIGVFRLGVLGPITRRRSLLKLGLRASGSTAPHGSFMALLFFFLLLSAWYVWMEMSRWREGLVSVGSPPSTARVSNISSRLVQSLADTSKRTLSSPRDWRISECCTALEEFKSVLLPQIIIGSCLFSLDLISLDLAVKISSRNEQISVKDSRSVKLNTSRNKSPVEVIKHIQWDLCKPQAIIKRFKEQELSKNTARLLTCQNRESSLGRKVSLFGRVQDV